MGKYNYSEVERATLEGMRAPFAVYQFLDQRVVTLVLSDGFCELFGYTDREEAMFDMDNSMYMDTHPDDVARISDAAYLFATEGGKYETFYRSRNTKGEGYRVIHAMGEHVYTKTGERLAHIWYTDEGLVGANGELPNDKLNQQLNRALTEDSISKANHFDFLTGLPGMTNFFQLSEARKESMLQRGEEPAILFLDMVGMKFFNRQNGFEQGNRFLREFALMISRIYGSENCSRFGGDHFAVLTDAQSLNSTLPRLQRDSQALNDGNSLPLRVGVYHWRIEPVAITVACDRAKIACDTIRNTLTSGVRYYDASMLGEAEKQRYIVSHLDQALAEGWTQVYYQPIVRAVNGRVCDEEALTRWIDPVRGFLSPGDFIPILEDAGLLYKLDLFVVDQIIEKLRRQAEAGLHLVPQSVNLSRSDFDACDMVQEICRRVDEAGLDHSLLTIEITESVIGNDFTFVKTQIDRFHSLGFSVWMDDFGSGYSSLDVLQSVKFDLIKFDMGFMQKLDEGESGKIILTELMRMATALGVDTVCEGVETAEQVRFLQEIGCSKLQGFYYLRPIPVEEIFRRYETGRQIGFENPLESAYYEAIGRVNLYDLNVIASPDGQPINHFYNVLPVAVLEILDGNVRFVRSNPSYRDFMRRYFEMELDDPESVFTDSPEVLGKSFMNMVKECCRSGNRGFVEEKLPDGSTVHTFVRRLAVNPVSGATAVAAVVLSVMDARQGTTYSHIARALASDYYNIFYVNLRTEEFIEYTSSIGGEELANERHGDHFFEQSASDAARYLYPEDQERFRAEFTKENVLRTLNEQGSFVIIYRLVNEGEPVYVRMKGRRMAADSEYVIFGVSNVDAQTKQSNDLLRIRQEQIADARIKAISGSYICLYSVDPETGHYTAYSSTDEYQRIGLPTEGEDFFRRAQREGLRTIFPEDLPRFQTCFTEERVMRAIEEHGVFIFRYRLIIGGEARPVCVRAGMVSEADGKKLIVGVHFAEKEHSQETLGEELFP